MAGREHRYAVVIRWTGNTGAGTSGYRDYGRTHEISDPGGAKPPIPGSSDPAFRGDPGRWNPEELLVAALSACHKLWYLHLCAEAGVVVTGYADEAEGVMEEAPEGGGRFRAVTLHPRVTIARDCDPALALGLHRAAHGKCFIAGSVAFPVACDPTVSLAG